MTSGASPASIRVFRTVPALGTLVILTWIFEFSFSKSLMISFSVSTISVFWLKYSIVTLPSLEESLFFEQAVNVKAAAAVNIATPVTINRLGHFMENLLIVSRNSIVY